jgi:hypothetical protein
MKFAAVRVSTYPPCGTIISHTNSLILIQYCVRFQVLTAANMKFRIVFWDVLPCKIIADRRFRGTCCLHHPYDHPEDNSELNTVLLDSHNKK